MSDQTPIDQLLNSFKELVCDRGVIWQFVGVSPRDGITYTNFQRVWKYILETNNEIWRDQRDVFAREGLDYNLIEDRYQFWRLKWGTPYENTYQNIEVLCRFITIILHRIVVNRQQTERDVFSFFDAMPEELVARIFDFVLFEMTPKNSVMIQVSKTFYGYIKKRPEYILFRTAILISNIGARIYGSRSSLKFYLQLKRLCDIQELGLQTISLFDTGIEVKYIMAYLIKRNDLHDVFNSVKSLLVTLRDTPRIQDATNDLALLIGSQPRVKDAMDAVLVERFVNNLPVYYQDFHSPELQSTFNTKVMLGIVIRMYESAILLRRVFQSCGIDMDTIDVAHLNNQKHIEPSDRFSRYDVVDFVDDRKLLLPKFIFWFLKHSKTDGLFYFNANLLESGVYKDKDHLLTLDLGWMPLDVLSSSNSVSHALPTQCLCTMYLSTIRDLITGTEIKAVDSLLTVTGLNVEMVNEYLKKNYSIWGHQFLPDSAQLPQSWLPIEYNMPLMKIGNHLHARNRGMAGLYKSFTDILSINFNSNELSLRELHEVVKSFPFDGSVSMAAINLMSNIVKGISQDCPIYLINRNGTTTETIVFYKDFLFVMNIPNTKTLVYKIFKLFKVKYAGDAGGFEKLNRPSESNCTRLKTLKLHWISNPDRYQYTTHRFINNFQFVIDLKDKKNICTVEQLVATLCVVNTQHHFTIDAPIVDLDRNYIRKELVLSVYDDNNTEYTFVPDSNVFSLMHRVTVEKDSVVIYTETVFSLDWILNLLKSKYPNGIQPGVFITNKPLSNSKGTFSKDSDIPIREFMENHSTLQQCIFRYWYSTEIAPIMSTAENADDLFDSVITTPYKYNHSDRDDIHWIKMIKEGFMVSELVLGSQTFKLRDVLNDASRYINHTEDLGKTFIFYNLIDMIFGLPADLVLKYKDDIHRLIKYIQ